MSTAVVVCTYKREELLHVCLRRLRGQDGDVPVLVFSDRGETSVNLERTCDEFEARLILQPKHAHYGNSFNAGEALRFAYNSGYDFIVYCEDDCCVKPDFFRWTREVHEDFGDIFCSCAWVGNQSMPFCDDTYFLPWIYIPQFSIKRDKLALFVEHLNPLYYGDLCKYIAQNFGDNPLNALYPQTVHAEIDGLIQRVLMKSGLQVAWSAAPKAMHIGYGGYNRGGFTAYEDFFEKGRSFAERVAQVEDFISDVSWRSHVFGKRVVECEEGREIKPQSFRYRMIQGEYESEFLTYLKPHQFGKKINSVLVTPETRFVVAS